MHVVSLKAIFEVVMRKASNACVVSIELVHT